MTNALAEHRAGRFSAAGAERFTGTLFDRLRQFWRDHRSYRSTLAQLRALTDRHLADIGMPRSDLRAIARAAAYRS